MQVNTIVKKRYQSEFVQIHNKIARTPLLTLKAKGMLLILMSLPDDWVIHINQLPQFCKESKTAVRSAFKELCEEGFVLSVSIRDEKSGKFKGYNYIAYHESQTKKELTIKNAENPINKAIHPHTENPHAVNPNTDNPNAENDTLQINTYTKTEKQKKILDKATEHDFSVFSFDVCVDMIANNKLLHKKDISYDVFNRLLENGYAENSDGYIVSFESIL